MLLRRVMDHVEAQNWFAVGLDFLIVVVGVFIGLQVSNWNDSRSDRALEHEYLIRLSDDLAWSADTIRNDIAELNDWHDSAMSAVAALQAGVLDPSQRDDFANGLVVGDRVKFVQGRYSTIAELTSTGRITLIRDGELRAAIGQLVGELEIKRRLIQLIGERQTETMDILQSRMLVLTLGTGQPDVQFDFESLSTDAAFINSFGNTAQFQENNVRWLDAVLTEVVALKILVDDELTAGAGTGAAP